MTKLKQMRVNNTERASSRSTDGQGFKLISLTMLWNMSSPSFASADSTTSVFLLQLNYEAAMHPPTHKMNWMFPHTNFLDHFYFILFFHFLNSPINISLSSSKSLIFKLPFIQIKQSILNNCIAILIGKNTYW